MSAVAPTTPPTTPPAILPALDREDDEVLVGDGLAVDSIPSNTKQLEGRSLRVRADILTTHLLGFLFAPDIICLRLVSIRRSSGGKEKDIRTATGRYAHCGTAVVLGIGSGYLMAMLVRMRSAMAVLEQTHTPSEATLLQEAFHWDHLGKSLSGAQLNGEREYIRCNSVCSVLAF